MKTFLEYEREFGGANRVLVALEATDGIMFDQEFFATLEKITQDVVAIDETDDARVRSLFTPNVRFVEVVEDGLAGGNVIPSSKSEEHTSELQSLMRISYAVFCLKKKNQKHNLK